MIPHVPTPSSNQGQLVASLAASLPAPPPPHYYSGADPRSQVSLSVNISSAFVKKIGKALEKKKITNIISPEKLP